MNWPRSTFILHLSRAPGLGGKTLLRVLARNDLLGRTSVEFLSLSKANLIEEYGLREKAADWISGRKFERATFELKDKLDKLGVFLAASTDAHFPVRIEQFDPNPPPLIYLYGNGNLLKTKTFSVLASRGAPPAVRIAIEQWTESAVLAGETLVSGHNTNEYQASAIVPLRWGSPRILVFDRGIFPVLGEDLRSEPFRAARLWRFQFDPHTDLAISPFPPFGSFLGVNNQIRDRLIASLSDRIDFASITPGGNMETLARLALKAGRPVRVSDRAPSYRALVEAGAVAIEH